MDVKVEFKYTKKEFNRGTRAAQFLIGSVSKEDLYIFPIAFLLAFFIPYIFIQVLVFLFALLGLLALFIRLYLFPLRAMKKSSTYQGEYRISFTEEGFLLENEEHYTRFAYGDFDKTVFSQEFIFFVQGDSVVFLPLRALPLGALAQIKAWVHNS